MSTPGGGSTAVRSHLLDALEADLVGPFSKPAGATTSDAPEDLRLQPSRWYLCGFLVPRDQGEIEEPDEGENEAGDDEDAEDQGRPDPPPKKARRLPASLGLSVFTSTATTELRAVVSWADYQRVEVGDRKV